MASATLCSKGTVSGTCMQIATRRQRQNARAWRVVSQVAAKEPITLHFGETSLTVPFSVEAAKGLSSAISSLLQTFKEKEKATRPQRWPSLEFREEGEEKVCFELLCNPNAYPNAFQAKVLVTVNDDKVRATSEGPLSAVKADVDQYLDAHS